MAPRALLLPVAVIGLCAFGAVPAAAAVHAPQAPVTASAYPPVTPSTSLSTSVLGTVITKAPSTVEPVVDGTTSGTLPFTGADVAGMSIVGIALIGGGGAAVMAGRRRRGTHR